VKSLEAKSVPLSSPAPGSASTTIADATTKEKRKFDGRDYLLKMNRNETFVSSQKGGRLRKGRNEGHNNRSRSRSLSPRWAGSSRTFRSQSSDMASPNREKLC